MTERPLFGLVLAGGESRRMGTDKALLLNDGESQLARAARLLAGVTDAVFVSTRAAQKDEPERAGYRQIIDRFEGMGPAAGILSALDEHADADWLVVACDLPNLSAATLQKLVEERGEANPFIAYRSEHNGLPEPLCAIFKSDARTIVRGFVDEDVYCPRKMMIRSNTLLLDQPERHALDNINTPEDLERSVLQANR